MPVLLLLGTCDCRVFNLQLFTYPCLHVQHGKRKAHTPQDYWMGSTCSCGWMCVKSLKNGQENEDVPRDLPPKASYHAKYHCLIKWSLISIAQRTVQDGVQTRARTPSWCKYTQQETTSINKNPWHTWYQPKTPDLINFALLRNDTVVYLAWYQRPKNLVSMHDRLAHTPECFGVCMALQNVHSEFIDITFAGWIHNFSPIETYNIMKRINIRKFFVSRVNRVGDRVWG